MTYKTQLSPPVRAHIVINIIKHLLFMRLQIPGTFDDLARSWFEHEHEQEHQQRWRDAPDRKRRKKLSAGNIKKMGNLVTGVCTVVRDIEAFFCAAGRGGGGSSVSQQQHDNGMHDLANNNNNNSSNNVAASVVTEIAVLFGSSPVHPKETYLVRFKGPPVSLIPRGAVELTEGLKRALTRKLLRTFIAGAPEVGSRELRPTNMHILLRVDTAASAAASEAMSSGAGMANALSGAGFFPKRTFKLKFPRHAKAMPVHYIDIIAAGHETTTAGGAGGGDQSVGVVAGNAADVGSATESGNGDGGMWYLWRGSGNNKFKLKGYRGGF